MGKFNIEIFSNIAKIFMPVILGEEVYVKSSLGKRETIIRGCEAYDSSILWQNIKGERIIVNCVMTNLNVLEGRVTFYFNKISNFYQLDSSLPIYGRCSERSLIFNSSIDKITKNEITVGLPEEVRFLENREFKRNHFGAKSTIYSKVDKKQEDLLGKSHFNLRLYDLSQSGASFSVKTQEKKLFKVGEVLSISSIDQNQLEVPVLCHVTHLTDVTEKDATSCFSFRKMGVRFDSVLSKDLYLLILENLL